MPKDTSAEGPIVRRTAYVFTAASTVWLMVAISVGVSFWAPLVGTVVGLICSVPAYLKEAEAEQNREAVRVRRAGAERRGDTSRWDVDDRGQGGGQAPDSDPTQPPKILES